MKYKRDDRAIKIFGLRMREIRIGKKITQEELAFETGMELSQIGRIERGVINTSITSVFTIAKALDVQPKELFDFDLAKKM